VHPLLCPFLASACSLAIFGLGLLCVGWLFRREEPDRWRRMSAHRVRNAVIGLVAIAGPTALVCLATHTKLIVLLGVVIPPILGAAVMGTFWGRLNHGKVKGSPIDREI
jgi:hypothetical protein